MFNPEVCRCRVCVNYTGEGHIGNCVYNYDMEVKKRNIFDCNFGPLVEHYVVSCTGFVEDWVKVVRKGRI